MRVSEVYVSVQGEGPFTGRPTTFVRFGGCNMRCPGWPCDTQHAIDPKFRSDWEKLNPIQLARQVPKYPQNVCLTGGEPFLQKDMELQEFCKQLFMAGHTIECFSNGSFVYPKWRKDVAMRIMMDWKLPGSGEAETALENRRENFDHLQMFDGVKFVVTGQEDLDFAYELYKELNWHLGPRPWVGAVWGRISDQDIIEYILKYELPWSLNVQVHKHIWDPDERGV